MTTYIPWATTLRHTKCMRKFLRPRVIKSILFFSVDSGKYYYSLGLISQLLKPILLPPQISFLLEEKKREREPSNILLKNDHVDCDDEQRGEREVEREREKNIVHIESNCNKERIWNYSTQNTFRVVKNSVTLEQRAAVAAAAISSMVSFTCKKSVSILLSYAQSNSRRRRRRLSNFLLHAFQLIYLQLLFSRFLSHSTRRAMCTNETERGKKMRVNRI